MFQGEYRHRKMFGLSGPTFLKFDSLLLLVDTNEEQCLKYYNNYCNVVHYVNSG